MPSSRTIVDPEARREELRQVSYEYPYPDNLKLKPGSIFHDSLAAKVMDRAREGHSRFASRRDDWRLMDQTLTAYIYQDKDELKVKARDKRKPISVVVPATYATMETLLTYMVSAFLKDKEIFRYDYMAPEDAVGTMLLEKVIALQSHRFKHPLALHTQWRDCFAYGLGITVPLWRKISRGRGTFEPTGYQDSNGQFVQTGSARGGTSDSGYEGHFLENISPYNFLPDPSVSIHRIQDAEYVGWLERTNVMNLLSLEQASPEMNFNAKYMKHVDGRSVLYVEDEGDDVRDKWGIRDAYGSRVVNTPVDVVNMYINLIPAEWKLGESEYPEKWYFRVAGDSVIQTAMPLGLNHNMYPIAICATEYDGYSISTPSKLEITLGLQTAADFLYNSHIANVRKAINDVLIVDPYQINIADLENPGPGGIVRTRRSMWGRGVQGAIEQLKITDITSNNIKDIGMILDLINRTSGTVDSVQGVMSQRGERISASESRDTRNSALSRLERMAMIIGMQSHQDLGYLMAVQTQQLMEESVYIKSVGRWEEELTQMFPNSGGRLLASPEQMDVDFDVLTADMGRPGAEFAEVWSQLFQTIVSQPLLLQEFDAFKIFKHIAMSMGAKNVSEFARTATPVQGQVLPDMQVQDMVASGQLQAVGGGMR